MPAVTTSILCIGRSVAYAEELKIGIQGAGGGLPLETVVDGAQKEGTSASLPLHYNNERVRSMSRVKSRTRNLANRARENMSKRDG